jgi:hypothetical protein
MSDLVLYIDKSVRLADNDQWQFRFQIPSETTDDMYTIAQNKSGKWWGCDCKGWLRTKNCKHLREMRIPGNYQKYEPKIIEQ